ncbi:hypothetical protein GTO89_06880 [Heliobacterium gestii]|uniref:Uncharacterized protein n=1 Tax=Heliomicrobium gestii TaxID=2699 RepID=A0A845LBR8_HELGE|nr:hypothetical protein [Heliomicrobium gestii]MBM7866452.1 hypothetical protein [Heliomicrobium gestii]MZP42764.1 hypothetical protein [Heliomicrobium gestii]
MAENPATTALKGNLRRAGDTPTIAPGDEDGALDAAATTTEVKQGESTPVTRLSLDEGDS